MKYLSKAQILESLAQISSVNQFFGFTFLAAKQVGLPVNETILVSLDSVNQEFLERYYRLDPRSKWFFRVFRYNNSDLCWLRPDYSGKGLQKLNTTTFKDAFIHTKKSKEWGWSAGYLDFLSTMLTRDAKIQTLHLAVWFFRSKGFENNVTRQAVVDLFYEEFKISPAERERLFIDQFESNLIHEDAFTDSPVNWKEITDEFDSAPDVAPDQGGILSYLELEGVGPINPLVFEPGLRMSIITGDNGLGKTFILEAAWWALTGTWAGRAALPNLVNGQRSKAKIKYLISGGSAGRPQTVTYSSSENKWPTSQKSSAIAGLIIYARVDGSFAIWDPVWQNNESDRSLVFTRDEVWDGKTGRIEGLIRDWTKWQDRPEKYPFSVLQRLIARMSPPEMAELGIGIPTRLPFDSREIPTIRHTYGEVPILNESAGIRRIVTLAYLIAWVWNEHKIVSEQFSKKTEKRIAILVDELEAHLHPRWQRTILPALLDVAKILGSELEIQLMLASHSPLVLASSETIFDSQVDKLFHLDTNDEGKVSFNEVDFVKYGRVNSWLTSPMFNLGEPMSNEGQEAIAKAIALQKRKDVSKEDVETVTALLVNSLSAEDNFWNRWIFFAKKFGVEI